MEINPLLLHRILEDQKTAWALLEQWIEDGTCYLHDVGGEGHPQDCIRCKTKEYLKPIRVGLATIEANLAKAQEVTISKGARSFNLKTVEDVAFFENSTIPAPEICKNCGFQKDRHIVGIMEILCPGQWKPGTRPRFEEMKVVKGA